MTDEEKERKGSHSFCFFTKELSFRCQDEMFFVLLSLRCVEISQSKFIHTPLSLFIALCFIFSTASQERYLFSEGQEVRRGNKTERICWMLLLFFLRITLLNSTTDKLSGKFSDSEEREKNEELCLNQMFVHVYWHITRGGGLKTGSRQKDGIC